MILFTLFDQEDPLLKENNLLIYGRLDVVGKGRRSSMKEYCALLAKTFGVGV